MPLAWIPTRQKLEDEIMEERLKLASLRGETLIPELPETPTWVPQAKEPFAPTEKQPTWMSQIQPPMQAWMPTAQPTYAPEMPAWQPTEMPTPAIPTTYKGIELQPQYKPKPWYQKAMGVAMWPFEMLHKHVEEPGAAIALSALTPTLPAKPGETWLEREKREYEAWKAPKFVKGITEFAISLPLFLIPYGGISLASSKALASVASKAGMVGSAKVVTGLGEIIPAVERLMALPFRVAGAGVRRVVARKVPLEVLPMEQISHQIGDIALPSVAGMAKKTFDKSYVWAVKDRFKPLEWVINKIDPSILAATPEARLTIGFNRVLDSADAMSAFQIAPLVAKGGTQFVKDLFGLDDLMRATKVTPKVSGASLDMDAIARFPSKYNLTAEQAEWLKVHRQVFQPVRDELKRAGILERELAFEEGEGGYLGRVVTKFIDPITKQEVDIRSGSLFTMGAKPTPKPRVIDDYNKAVELGYRYADPLTTTAYRIRQGLYALANKDYVEAMMGIPGVRTIGAKALPERITRDFAQQTARTSKFVLDRLRRVTRGERLSPASLRAIKNKNPEIAGLLGTTPSAQELKAAIKRLDAQLKQERIMAKRAAGEAAEKLAKTRRPALITEGTVFPIPGLRNRIVPRSVADYINRELGVTQNRWIGSLASAQGVVRMLQTGIDLGPYFLQGLPTLMTNPKVHAKAVKSSMEILLGDEATAAKLLSQPIHQETLAKLIPHGFTLNTGEFVEAAPLLGRLPFAGPTFIRWARWFNSALDFGRLYEAEALLALPSIRQAGDTGVRAVVDHLGKKWGAMSTRWLGIPAGQRQVENALLFYASRWTRSGIALLKDATTRGGMEGVLARDTVGRMMLGMTATYYGFCKALGQEPNLDPSSGKFMTIQLGTQHVGFGGMYIALARFGGNVLRTLSENPSAFVTTVDSRDMPVTKFVRGRVAPLTGVAIDIITGKTFLGEPVDNPINFAKYVGIRNLTPFWLSGVLEGVVGAEPMPGGAAAAEFFGARTWPLRAWERRDDLREQYAQVEYNKSWAELKVLDRRELENKHSDLKDLTTEAWRESITKGRPSQLAYGQWKGEYDAINQQYEQSLWDLQAQVDKGIKSPYDFRESAIKLGAARAFALKHIDAKPEYSDVVAALYEPKLEPEVTPQFEDVAYNIYTKLMFSGDLEMGIDNYDFEEADRRKQWFITNYGQATYDYVIQRLRSGKDVPPLMQEYYKAQEVLRPYWEVRTTAIKTFGIQYRGLNRIISAERKRMARANSQIRKYLDMFYVQPER